MTRPWFPPVPILEVGRAVERAAKAAPKPRRRKPTKAMREFDERLKANDDKHRELRKSLKHSLFDSLIGGRFAIKEVNKRFEIWDADSHDVFGNYRTYDDAYRAAEKLL